MPGMTMFPSRWLSRYKKHLSLNLSRIVCLDDTSAFHSPSEILSLYHISLGVAPMCLIFIPSNKRGY
jgi:hypothetical protein